MPRVDQLEHLTQLGMVCGGVSLLIHWLALFGGHLEACMIALLLWGSAAAIYIYRDRQKVNPSRCTVFVSGCDSGFGLDLTLQLHENGFRVLAGCLHSHSTGAIRLKQERSKRLIVIQLDVSDPIQVEKAAQEVTQLVQSDGLWCLVNNAGVQQVGAVEWVPLENYRTTMEVNLMGTISLTKALLPLIRNVKGRIVTVSSVVGDLPSPFLSPYVASKHAIEGFSECLRLEMKQWGVDVILVQPGDYTAGTNILTLDKMQSQIDNMWTSMSEEVKSAYGKESLKVLFSCWSKRKIEEDNDKMNNVQNKEKDYKMDKHNTEMDCNNNIVMPKKPDTSSVIETLSSAVIQRWPHAIYRPMDIRLRLKQAIAQHVPYSVFETIYYTR